MKEAEHRPPRETEVGRTGVILARLHNIDATEPIDALLATMERLVLELVRDVQFAVPAH
jgi:hypothetical protein